SSVALAYALESLAIRSRYQRAAPEAQRAKIQYLEARFGALWGEMGAVAEAFGLAYAEAEDLADAIRWYKKALAANDASASLKASEQLGNLSVRHACEAVDQALRKDGKISAAQLTKARKQIGDAHQLLERLVALQPSIERWNLLGSAWKRLALIEAIAKRPRNEVTAIGKMRESYAKAEALARDTDHSKLFYPVSNRMAAELVLNLRKPSWEKFDPAKVNEVRKSLATKARDDPDFCSVAGFTELRMYTAIADRTLAAELPQIEDELEDLFTRVSVPSMWSSIVDQASFVLPKYAVRAAGAERRAAEALLKRLRSYVRAH
ncbi:MAG: tetratricopeptide repeat-containing protein, partial [Burkholderiaceae bacterium]